MYKSEIYLKCRALVNFGRDTHLYIRNVLASLTEPCTKLNSLLPLKFHFIYTMVNHL